MKESLIDISVLLIFFTRHKQFKQVFEQVKKARPSELFLYQDGPRLDHPDDMENIKKCREIANDIDWKCKIHRFYQTKNIGVDPSGYIADTWAFSQTNKCIVLEDDVVPSVSFFSFCKIMLDKYENDERIMLISGFNPEEITNDISADYFFSATTFTWGWASWARVVNKWDIKYSFLKDKNKRKQVQKYISQKGLVKNMLNIFEEHLDSGKEHFETLLISNQYLHEGLTIVPKRNMVNNIGVVADSAHYADDIEMIPKGYRRIFTMSRFELDIKSIIHPDRVSDFPPYKDRTYRIYAWGHFGVKIYRMLEVSFYQLKKGDFKNFTKNLMYKLKKFITRTNA